MIGSCLSRKNSVNVSERMLEREIWFDNEVGTKQKALLEVVMYMPSVRTLQGSRSHSFVTATSPLSSPEHRARLLGRRNWWCVRDLAGLDVGPLVSM